MKKIKPPKKKVKKEQSQGFSIKTIAIAWAVIMCVVVGGVAIGLLVFGDRSTDTNGQEGTQAQDDTHDITLPEHVIYTFPYELVLGDMILTNAEYNFYFTELKFQAEERYFNMLGHEPFDVFVHVGEQMHFDGNQTWEDYIHKQVAEMFMMYAQALASGTSLTEGNLEMLADNEEWIAEIASMDGMTLDELIDDHFPGMTWEMFRRHMERDMLVRNWVADEMAGLSFSDAEMDTFFEANWPDFAPWSYGEREMYSRVDVRHILIQSLEIGIDAAREAAEEILAEWRDGLATESSFADLATLRTEDPGSAHTGGLYTDVFPGDMVPEFDAWIFAPHRSFGDTDIVDTMWGSHVMFFVDGYDRVENWQPVTEAEMARIAFDALMDSLSEIHNVQRRTI